MKNIIAALVLLVVFVVAAPAEEAAVAGLTPAQAAGLKAGQSTEEGFAVSESSSSASVSQAPTEPSTTGVDQVILLTVRNKTKGKEKVLFTDGNGKKVKQVLGPNDRLILTLPITAKYVIVKIPGRKGDKVDGIDKDDLYVLKSAREEYCITE